MSSGGAAIRPTSIEIQSFIMFIPANIVRRGLNSLSDFPSRGNARNPTVAGLGEAAPGAPTFSGSGHGFVAEVRRL